MTAFEASQIFTVARGFTIPPSAFTMDDEYEPMNDYDEFFDTEEDAVGDLT